MVSLVTYGIREMLFGMVTLFCAKSYMYLQLFKGPSFFVFTILKPKKAGHFRSIIKTGTQLMLSTT